MSSKQKPLLLVISAPSGAGKSSLCNRLVEKFPQMVYSISCTTRPPRGNEQDGVHYHFLSEEEFSKRIARGEFLEHALVHGNRYGTLKQTVYDALAQGRDIIMDIDVQGAKQIRLACAALADDDDHWSARVISASFKGKSRVQQHQMVYRALGSRMGNELHALALQTGVPEE